MSSDNHEHDRDRDRERPGGKQVAPAPAGGALSALVTLQTALANVNTAAIIGRTGLPLLLFKSREDSGTWGFGQRRTIPEEGSQWAINPLTFKWGAICFNGNKVVDECLVSVSQPKPLITELPDTGFPWQEEWAVNLKCISGADAGVEVIFKANTDGGIKAIVTLVDLIRDRINSGQHDGKVAPIVTLQKDSYQHSQYGKVWFPVLNTIDWMPLDGPAPAPTPAEPTPPVDQPRRRRVA
jgi:hypothetical protein